MNVARFIRRCPIVTQLSTGQVRVIDESSEDYFYPASFFAPIKLLRTLRWAVLTAV